MSRKKTAVLKWLDEALRTDPDFAKAVDEMLQQMRHEQDELERSRKAPPEMRGRRRTRR